MKEKISIRQVGHSLYVRIPRWLVLNRDLQHGDMSIWKLDDEDLEGNSEVRLQLVKTTKLEAAE
jgi:hypothetical protein